MLNEKICRRNVPSLWGSAQLFIAYSTEKAGQARDNLLRDWCQGREKGRENLNMGRLTAAWSLLTECSTISYMVINSSHDLAVVSVESNLHKCHSAFWHLCGQFQWGQWMAILMSGLAAGMILESRMDDTTAAYYRVTWQCCQPHEIIQQFRSPTCN